MLLDPYNEFFVHKAQTTGAVLPGEVEEDDLGLMGITGRQLQQALVSVLIDLLGEYRKTEQSVSVHSDDRDVRGGTGG